MDSSSRKRPLGDGTVSPAKRPKGGPDQERIQKMMAEARAKAAALAAKLGANKSIGSSQSPPISTPPPAAQSAAERLAAMRSRVANAVSRSTASATTPTTGRSSSSTSAISFRRDEPDPDEVTKARGGLDIDTGSSRRGKNAMQPKFATTMANRRSDVGKGSKPKKQLDLSLPSTDLIDPTKNPYYDPNIAAKNLQPRRIPKSLHFNEKGKYIEQANALRRQEALEEMKKRIAAAARKVGIDEDMHADKAFAPPEPPEIEWWDQGLTTNNTYADIEAGLLKIDTDDSIVTLYIQHPIQLEPPQDKHIPLPKPLPLTKQEQKKVRRQRRAEELKEKQAKVRLGLEPPPPPKIKKSNMMRVLGEEAVKDPTAVEARVNKEIRERLENHLRQNEERKLSQDQRHEKLLTNQEKDVAKGVQCLVFRVESLANGKHRFKINKNAEQLGLTGICIFSPKFNLVIVEGGPYAITKYKKLMLNRIDWTEDAEPLEDADAGEQLTHGADIPMAQNKCTLVWEGELKQRGFRKFSSERCPTDAMAKERLERGKMEYMWTQAKNIIPKEE
ncbi:pre-mRNA processing factor 3-domain-containing protein [Trichophaea hybrida]|nr:pre-mRNA processing factor 3-domain-containing protein [Trichophaea hybrida]